MHYSIFGRSYHYYSAQECSGQLEFSAKETFFDLNHLGIVSLKGDNARSFLQGQMTCDINQITEHRFRQGAFCNLKGRILALATVFYWDGFKLILPKDLLKDTLSTLEKAAQLSRVAMYEEERFSIQGLYSLNSSLEKNQASSAAGQCALGLDRYRSMIISTPPASSPALSYGSLGWHLLGLKNGDIEIYPSTQGAFLPHRLDLHKTTYIAFDKGCYKGQEIIARTHYRAKLKHQLSFFVIEQTELFPQQKIYTLDKTREIGEIIDYTPYGEHLLLACSMVNDHPLQICLENQLEERTLRLV